MPALTMLSPMDEFLIKLIGGDQSIRENVESQRDKLQAAYNYHAADRNGMLQAVMDYELKFKKLPTWDDLHDYIWELNPFPAGTVAEYEELKGIAKEEPEFAYTSLDILISKVVDEVELQKFAVMMQQAKIIATSGIQDRKTGVVSIGPADASRYLASKLSIPNDLQQEPDEITLLSGNADGGSFVITGRMASTIKPEPVFWVWPNRIPLGAMSLIAGQQDNGKTTVAIDIVARTTRGLDWPDGEKNSLGPRSVIMVTAEDGLSKVMVPRLMAAGADLDKVIFFKHVYSTEFDEKTEKTKSERRRLQLALDVPKLRKLVESQPDVALVVIDTLTSFWGDININADREVRPIMDALGMAFENCNATLLGLIHHNKKSDADAIQKILGSSSVSGSVRAAYGCTRDPESEDEYYFAHVKGNWTKKRGSVKYKLTGKQLGADINVPFVEWLGESDEDANGVMAIAKDARDDKKQGVSKARLFLPQALEKGQKSYKDLMHEAEIQGVSKDQMYRAKDDLGVKSVKRGHEWFWFLNKEQSVLEDVKDL